MTTIDRAANSALTEAKLKALDAEAKAAFAVFGTVFIGTAAAGLASSRVRQGVTTGLSAAVLIGSVGLLGYGLTKLTIAATRWMRRQPAAPVEAAVDQVVEAQVVDTQELSAENLADLEVYAQLQEVVGGLTVRSIDFTQQPNSGTGDWYPKGQLEEPMRAGTDSSKRLVFELDVMVERPEGDPLTRRYESRIALFQRYTDDVRIWVVGAHAGRYEPDGEFSVQEVQQLIRGEEITRANGERVRARV